MKARWLLTVEEWVQRYDGGATETRELAESLTVGAERTPALQDDPALCSAAKDLLEALDRFDAELERIGFGEG